MRLFRRRATDPELRAELAAASEHNAQLRGELAEYDAALKVLRESTSRLTASNAVLRRQNENLRVEKAEVLGRLDVASRRIVDLSAENTDLNYELADAQGKAQQISDAVGALRAEVEAVKKAAALVADSVSRAQAGVGEASGVHQPNSP